jgi:hypothetical protein
VHVERLNNLTRPLLNEADEFSFATVSEICDTVISIRSDATGVDGKPLSFIKSILPVVLTHIFNHIFVSNNRDPEIRLNGHRLEIKNTHKILELTFDNRLTWKTHIDEVRANASKRMNLLKYLAGINWGANQGMLLRVHEMMVLSTLEFGSAAYGSARDRQLKRLEPVYNKGLRIAIEAFCVCRAENILCELGVEAQAIIEAIKPTRR